MPRPSAPSTPPRASATGRGARTRAAILEAATRVFAVHGYRGGSLAAIAGEAELTQPGVLHHFPSKEHVLMAVLQERDRENVKQLRSGPWHDGGVTALRTLLGLVEDNAIARERVQMFTALVGEGVSAAHPAHDFFVERYAHLRYQLIRALQRGQDAGEFRSDVDMAMIASLVLAAMDGLQIQWLLDDEETMPPRFAVLLDMLVTYLAAEPPAPG
ncbi:AcrR family transcriptional regulator [Actinoplanes tereljensis]|uniref:TetR family transcriptional regulator n=1 Tax=Paractinoplanes tereljensis TaxID=571912 RepID=A0A919NZL8_9ACTN|nr:TetR/AcrR family transcriptional regulator [Actinoplanes tereljensis]GIF26729.1 TetR family transcriptional regulator [Actinoplanes tereljensis]